MNDRCTKWTRHRDQVLRCEGIQGHMSVHFNGDHWWPNKTPVDWLLGAIVISAVAILAVVGWIVWSLQ
jgi:hypothetical protein